MSSIDSCSSKSAQRDRIEFLVPFISKRVFMRLARVFRYEGQMVLWRDWRSALQRREPFGQRVAWDQKTWGSQA